MISPQVFKYATVVMALLLVGLLGYATVNQSRPPQRDPQLDKNGSRSKVALDMGSFGSTNQASSEIGNQANRPANQPQLQIGVIRSTPRRSQISQIDLLPTLDSKVRRLYNAAKDKSCRILSPGSAVKANLLQPKPDTAGSVGRVPAITIGLEMDSAGRSKLPKVTRGQVDDYFAKHRLSVQPMVYFDEQGRYYFGTDCYAAFFETARPGIAIKPEPMIQYAVERFRALGVVGSKESNDGLTDDLGRTLMMAFTFEKTDETISSLGGGDQLTTELLLFHLPENLNEGKETPRRVSSRDQFPIEVFLTSGQRTVLQRLDLSDRRMNAPVPTISSDVRFDKMVLMGLYPAEPVVTDIHYRSTGSISMELINRLMTGTDGQSGLSLDQILDQFGGMIGSDSSMTMASDRPSISTPISDQDDARWIEEIARRKYERLNKALQPAKASDRSINRSQVPRMTGVGK